MPFLVVEVGDTPGTGTFYDFFDRLWDSEEDNLSPHIHPVKAKVKKPKNKGAKAESVEKITVAKLLPQLENTSFSLEGQPYHSLLQIYKKQFLDVSVSKGLICRGSLSAAGDGTPVVTSHRMRSHRICDCAPKESLTVTVTAAFPSLTAISDGILPENAGITDTVCTCSLHLISESDLPVFPLLNPASRHDSLGFLETFFRMKSFLPDLHITKLLLDSAT